MKAQRNEIKLDRMRLIPPENMSAGPMTTCTGICDRSTGEVFVKRGLIAQIKRERPSSQSHREDS